MICPKCQNRSRVFDSRSLVDDSSNEDAQPILNLGEQVYGWWTDEFRVRQRECLTCQHCFETIEVNMDDLANAFLELAREGIVWPVKEFQENPR
ncbi:MAG: hypothetical protein GY847_34860 [Proteobacteria bacterium]|nr:hypothetical protein [Pseudomonadota bacterium]